jgi:hypothetical protein
VRGTGYGAEAVLDDRCSTGPQRLLRFGTDAEAVSACFQHVDERAQRCRGQCLTGTNRHVKTYRKPFRKALSLSGVEKAIDF